MNITGIIAEYNPFHNGHAYHIAEAKRITNADYIICVMSGNYVQRGTPALLDKYTRTKEALSGGADLVVELPVTIATGSAAVFAEGAVKMLYNMGCTHIAFGSECNDLKQLSNIARTLLFEPPVISESIKQQMSKGISYPKARENALISYFNDPSISDIITSPNNILSIEYLRVILGLEGLTPVLIHRTGSQYHDKQLTRYASASAIRSAIYHGTDYNILKDSVPSRTLTDLSSCIPMHANDFTPELQYAIYQHLKNPSPVYSGPDCIMDFNEDLYHRMENIAQPEMTYAQVAKVLMSRQITNTRASRALLHFMLQLTNKDAQLQRKCCTSYYRLLGVRKDATPFIRILKDQYHCRIITKLAQSELILNADAQSSLIIDLQSSLLYYRIASRVAGKYVQNDYEHSPIIYQPPAKNTDAITERE